jgi:hypothetical protein
MDRVLKHSYAQNYSRTLMVTRKCSTEYYHMHYRYAEHEFNSRGAHALLGDRLYSRCTAVQRLSKVDGFYEAWDAKLALPT